MVNARYQWISFDIEGKYSSPSVIRAVLEETEICITQESGYSRGKLSDKTYKKIIIQS